MSTKANKRTALAGIARMPASLQEKISRLLVDGGTWKQVSELCNKHGFDGVNAQNVTNYRRGAHAKWLAKQDRLNSERQRYALRVELVEKYAKEGGPAEAALMSAMEMIEEAMGGFDVSDLRAMVENKPEKLLAMMETMLKMRREMAAMRQESISQELALAKVESASEVKKKGLDADAVARIEAAMNLK